MPKRSTNKPIVHYEPLDLFFPIQVGISAIVFAHDHPKHGKGAVRTSTVKTINQATRQFETENTVYVPYQKPL